MPFLVYEPDPLVLTDISETLMGAFADSDIVLADSPKALSDLAANMRRPFVAIISVTSDDLDRVLKVIGHSPETVRVVVISNDASALSSFAGAFIHLQRPFSTETLLRAVRSAYADLPEGRTQKPQ